MINSDTPDILKDIVELKRARVEERKKSLSMLELESLISKADQPLNFSGRLMGEGIRVIAEVKRASPSKGVFKEGLDAANLARAYAENGAAAISVLTNEDHFKGSIDDMAAAHSAVFTLGVPVLRKEFIFDPYQIYEARAFGADAILLIVSMLDEQQIKEFMGIASSIWIQCLVEVHNELELEKAVKCNADIIGINNRNLHTFDTTLETTERLAPLVPYGNIIVSESGISDREDVKRVESAGAKAILVGESLVRSADPGKALRTLV